MSEPEFEMYLSLMSKFLRLTSAQRPTSPRNCAFISKIGSLN